MGGAADETSDRWSESWRLDVPDATSREVEQQLLRRLLSRDFDRWAEQASRIGHCLHPIRLRGQAVTLDGRTGEVLSSYDSSREPDGVAYLRCRNRRASVCPSCSHEYKGDMWHLLAAGAAGGMKGVPQTVAAHPLVFATLTAPSFGPVHTTRTGAGSNGRCHPERRDRCRHGRPRACLEVHTEDDERLGEPLCADCYDYRGQVVWQWWAPELWRRFTIALQRALAAHLGVAQSRLREHARVSFAKVAEFQRRGVVHFHALIRLDGPTRAATDDDPFPAPSIAVDASQLAALVRTATPRVRVVAPAAGSDDRDRILRFGQQVDARAVHSTVSREAGVGARELHPETVAAYIAKYATKACEDFGLPGGLRDPAAAFRLNLRPHVCRLVTEVAAVASSGVDDYAPAARWLHMLGFRGHYASKSRSYSTTLGRLRDERRRHQVGRLLADRGDVTADASVEDSTLVVGSWEFEGIGWLTPADALLAAQAAAKAREWRTQPHPRAA